MGSLGDVGGKRYLVFYRFYAGWNLRRFSQNPNNLHLKASRNHRTALNNNWAQFHEKPPAHFSATYAIIFFTKISRIGFPGNLVKIFISSDSEFFTESESLFRLGKIRTGKKSASQNSAYTWWSLGSIFYLLRFYLNQIEILIQWKILNLMI